MRLKVNRQCEKVKPKQFPTIVLADCGIVVKMVADEIWELKMLLRSLQIEIECGLQFQPLVSTYYLLMELGKIHRTL